MKQLSVFLALCIVVMVGAAPSIHESDVINYAEGAVNELVSELEQIAADTAKALEHQVEEIVLTPLNEVDDAVQAIDERRAEQEACVAEHDERVAEVVDAMHADMAACGTSAAQTSAEIVVDVNAATQQLIFDGYDVLTTYQKCKNYKNTALKSSCYARLSIKATIYLKTAPKSIKIIKQSANERLPAVFVDADACTHDASARAIAELDQIQAAIDACV